MKVAIAVAAEPKPNNLPVPDKKPVPLTGGVPGGTGALEGKLVPPFEKNLMPANAHAATVIALIASSAPAIALSAPDTRLHNR